MTNPKPFSPEEIEVLRGMATRLLAMDDEFGGWTSKIDARQTGFSLHVKFDRKVSAQAALSAAVVFDQAPIKLCQIATRILDQLDAATTDGAA